MKQGIEQGLEQGKKIGQTEVLTTILRQRLGAIDENLISKIGNLTQESIGLLTSSLLDFASEADLREWLDRQEH